MSSEFIHVTLDAIPRLNVIQVYLEANSDPKDEEVVQKVKGENCVIVGDTNDKVNEEFNKNITTNF